MPGSETVSVAHLKSCKGDAFALVALLLVSMTVMSPVLIWPHWGLFSDAAQIIERGRIFWANPGAHLELLNGYWRPGFHIIDLTLWRISPNNPFGFYLFRSLVFAISVCLTYRNSLLLSGSRLISVIAALMWFIASPTYEVIYTLDKGELYIACLFGAALAVYLDYDLRLSADRMLPAISGRSLTAIFLIAAYAMFTKETAQLLLVFGLISFFSCIALGPQGDPGLPRFSLNKRSRWAGAFFGSVILAFGCYRIFFYVTGGAHAKAYVEMDNSFRHLIEAVRFYSMHVADYVVLLVVALGGSVVFLREGRKAGSTWQHAAGLAVTCLIGSCVLLQMRVCLTYIWFPLYGLLIPAAAYYLSFCSSIFGGRFKHSISFVPAVIVAVCLLRVPTSFHEAQLQFQLDALTEDLTKRLAQLAVSDHLHKQPIVIPFASADPVEIAERIEFLTFDKLIPDYLDRQPGFYPDPAFEFYDLIGYSLPGGVERVMESQLYVRSGRGEAKMPGCAETKDLEPGLCIYSYWQHPGYSDHPLWVKEKLLKGAWLLVPFGNLPRQLTDYRGAGLFQQSWQEWLALMPQLRVAPIFELKRRLGTRGGKEMGWAVLRVEDSPPFSWTINSRGWLPDPCRIYYSGALSNRHLMLTMDNPSPRAIKVSSDKSQSIQAGETGSSGSVSFDICLPLTGEKEHGSITIAAPDSVRAESQKESMLGRVNRAFIR